MPYEFFSLYSFAGIILLLLFGLILGSFLNVVIYRLPLILIQEWRESCQNFLNDYPISDSAPQKKLSLALPHSHCVHCQHPLKPWHNIPVLSFICLRGRCAYCKTPISWRYPLVEGLTVLVFYLVYLRFGFSLMGVFAGLASILLLVMSYIDYDTQFLPDGLNYGLLWLGLIANTCTAFTPLSEAIWGAVVGYLILWIVAKSFFLLRKKEGIGQGDFKLLAALGAWLGWKALLPILLLSSFVGALIGLICLGLGRMKRDQPLPFGPFLAGAGWLYLLYGHFIPSFYLGLN